MSPNTDLLLLFGDPDKGSDGLEARLSIPTFEARLHVDRATDAHHYIFIMNAVETSRESLPRLSSFELVGTPYIDTIIPSPDELIRHLIRTARRLLT